MSHVIIIAGPNGAGKSTTAPELLRGALGVDEFVNADTIAQGLSAFNPEGAAFHAGRVMLERLRHLAAEGKDFAFETTLATRSYAPWLKELKKDGYTVHLIFLWLPSPEMAVARVAERVRMGGHNVPGPTVCRRYHKGLANFFQLFGTIADSWIFFDNSATGKPQMIASFDRKAGEVVKNALIWKQIEKGNR